MKEKLEAAMMTREEWLKELHKRTADFREGRSGGQLFFDAIAQDKNFSFWRETLSSPSTWVTKTGEHLALEDIDDDHLVNIWNYMIQHIDYMSLAWVSTEALPSTAHKELPEDWLEATPIMQALSWELFQRKMDVQSVPLLDYSDVYKIQKLSWEDMVE